MPPHCDSLDGPVVRAARRALDAGNIALVLPYARKTTEKEIIDAFGKVVQGEGARAGGRALPSPRPPSRQRPPWRGQRAVVCAGHAWAAGLGAWALSSDTGDRSRAGPHTRLRTLSFLRSRTPGTGGGSCWKCWLPGLVSNQRLPDYGAASRWPRVRRRATGEDRGRERRTPVCRSRLLRTAAAGFPWRRRLDLHVPRRSAIAGQRRGPQ